MRTREASLFCCWQRIACQCNLCCVLT